VATTSHTGTATAGCALPTKTRSLLATIDRRLPNLGDVELGYSWCGRLPRPPDGLAYLGEHSRYRRCRFALGYGGNGITYSALGAQYVAGALLGPGAPPEQHIFLT